MLETQYFLTAKSTTAQTSFRTKVKITLKLSDMCEVVRNQKVGKHFTFHMIVIFLFTLNLNLILGCQINRKSLVLGFKMYCSINYKYKCSLKDKLPQNCI